MVQHVATEAFASLSPELQGLSYAAIKENPSLRQITTRKRFVGNPSKHRSSFILPVSLGPCLKYYSIISQEKELKTYLIRIILSYFDELGKNRLVCEIFQCSTEAIDAHHLVPRCVHRLSLKRGWDPIKKRGNLDDIAWLCRGCHVFVHRVLVPRALATDYWSVQLLLTKTEIWQYAMTIRKLVQEID